MSTYESSYCSQADIQFVLPEMAKYNQRTILNPNWVASATSNLYYNYSTGPLSVLFKDGKDLGAEQGSEPSSNDQWRYVEADGRLEYFLSSSSASALNGAIFEGGIDADTHLTSVIARSSDFVRSMAGIPIYPRKGVGVASATGNDWPELIVMSTAHMAASFITAPYDLELSNQLADKVSNSENTGWLDLLRRGDITINQQESLQKNKGIVRRVSINGSSTSDIVDVRGTPSVLWDSIKISIDSGTGGTLARGSNSTIQYSTKGSDDDGLQVEALHTAETVTGGWDEVGRGMFVRWSPGVLTAGDTWEMEISGEIDSSTTPIKMSMVERI
tara:strand:+ start:2895 stop:3884 length:990 start_codon:yes stop_codon:yes gene_type:complete